MVAPTVLNWARRTGRSPSRYLIPISFAAILGGLLTLIGTSTNLVISGLLEASGHQPLGLFEIGYVGLPIAVAGLTFLVLFGPRLLPDRHAPGQDLGADMREFTVEMVVSTGSPSSVRPLALGDSETSRASSLSSLNGGAAASHPSRPKNHLRKTTGSPSPATSRGSSTSSAYRVSHLPSNATSLQTKVDRTDASSKQSSRKGLHWPTRRSRPSAFERATALRC